MRLIFWVYFCFWGITIYLLNKPFLEEEFVFIAKINSIFIFGRRLVTGVLLSTHRKEAYFLFLPKLPYNASQMKGLAEVYLGLKNDNLHKKKKSA